MELLDLLSQLVNYLRSLLVRHFLFSFKKTRKSHVLISINITGLPLRPVKRGFHVHALAISSLSDNIAEGKIFNVTK